MVSSSWALSPACPTAQFLSLFSSLPQRVVALFSHLSFSWAGGIQPSPMFHHRSHQILTLLRKYWFCKDAGWEQRKNKDTTTLKKGLYGDLESLPEGGEVAWLFFLFPRAEFLLQSLLYGGSSPRQLQAVKDWNLSIRCSYWYLAWVRHNHVCPWIHRWCFQFEKLNLKILKNSIFWIQLREYKNARSKNCWGGKGEQNIFPEYRLKNVPGFLLINCFIFLCFFKSFTSIVELSYKLSFFNKQLKVSYYKYNVKSIVFIHCLYFLQNSIKT